MGLICRGYRGGEALENVREEAEEDGDAVGDVEPDGGDGGCGGEGDSASERR